MHVMKEKFIYAFENHYWDQAKAILEKYPSLINTPQSHKNTALMRAASKNNTEIMEYLLHKGANINAQNKTVDTALIWAAAGNSKDAVKLLIKKEANLDLAQKDGITALIRAIKDNNTDIALLLIDAGASLRQTGPRGKTALDYALDSNNKTIINAILDKISVDGFIKHDEHTVFSRQEISCLNTSIKRIFNFQANEMTRITKSEAEMKIENIQYADMTDLSGVERAANALEKLGGQAGHSWRNPQFKDKAASVTLGVKKPSGKR